MKTVMTLKDTCEFYNGIGFPMVYQGKTAGKYPFYKVGDISKNVQLGNSYLKECDNYVDDDTLNKLRGVLIPANSIVFAKIGEALKLNRRTITSTPCLVDNNVIAIHPNEEILDVEYFYYFMKTVNMADYSSSTTVPSVKKSSLEIIVVPTPELNEQKRISSELNTISVAIRSKKDELSSLNELVKSRFIEMFGDIVRNDKSWTTEIITKVCPIKQYDGRITECDGKIWLLNLDLVESNTGVILDKYYVAKTEIGNSTISFSEDNVLYSKLRPYLNKVVVPDGNGYATSELIPFFPLSQVNKYYLAYALRSESFVTLINSKAGGAKMPRAPMDFIRSFPLPVPPSELQNEFAEFVKLIDKSKFIVQQQIKDLQELLDSKMDEYFR